MVDIDIPIQNKHQQPPQMFKDTYVNWLGKIPSHWKFSKVKFGYFTRLGKMLQPQPQSSEDTLEAYLRSANVLWEGVDISNIQTMWFSPAEKKKFEITSGDLIICEGGDVGRASIWQGQISPCFIQNAVHRVRPKVGFSNKFLYYWLSALKKLGYIDLICSKATISHLTEIKLANLPLIIPPINEQIIIVLYLDRETTRIDALIAKYQHLIQLLEEKFISIISQTVTRGLDSSTPLCEAGIEWFGRIPETWEVGLLKRYFQVDLGKMLDSSKQSEQGWRKPYLRAANIHWGKLLIDDINEMIFNNSQLEHYRLIDGDLLVTEGGVTVGRSAIWHDEMEECYYQNSINRVRPKNSISTKYLFYWLYFLKENGYIEMVAEKATFGHLTKEKLENIPVVIPPKDEEVKIIEFLDEIVKSIGSAKSKIEKIIDKLNEYRALLISAVVTGKINVTS